MACAEDNRYALLVEFPSPQPESWQLEGLLAAVDAYLGEANIEYEAKRRSRRLGAPCLHLMRDGWFGRLHRRRIAQGARDSQFKAPILSTTFEEGELEEVQTTVSLPSEPRERAAG